MQGEFTVPRQPERSDAHGDIDLVASTKRLFAPQTIITLVTISLVTVKTVTVLVAIHVVVTIHIATSTILVAEAIFT